MKNPKFLRSYMICISKSRIIQLSVLSFLIVMSSSFAQQYNKGVGIYPGDPKENFAPSMKANNNYRNIALNKPAYSSSSYDFNLTAQLVTDGIKDSKLPGWIVISTSGNPNIPRNEREYMLDRHAFTMARFVGSQGWVQIEMAGNYVIPDVDSINFTGQLAIDSMNTKPWEFFVTASNDGVNWDKIASVKGEQVIGDSLTGWAKFFSAKNVRNFNYSYKLDTKAHYRIYRLNVNSPNVLNCGIDEFALIYNGKRINIGGPYHFFSAWKSLGAKDEWLYVDLGAVCSFDKISLSWIRRAKAGAIQISNDAKAWKEVGQIKENSSDEIKFDKQIKARYVRLVLTQPVSPDGYILSELEIFGTGAPVAVAHKQAVQKKNGDLYLSGGAWKLQRSTIVNDSGEKLSSPGVDDSKWIVATVPGTVLISYFNAGAVVDPDYSDNQMQLSDSYFYSDFWYRNEFNAPTTFKGKRTFLNFDGINWKAEVFLNSKKLGNIEGAFTRARFDVTDNLIPGTKNVIAVRIVKNDSPGFVKEQTKLNHDVNGGDLGADNPTFHATVGWDWIPSMRGRDIGIWNDVYLSATGSVTVNDPLVISDLPLPDTTSAALKIEVTLKNHASDKINGKLVGKFGDVKFEQKVSLTGTETKTVKLDQSIKNPKLWWPNGYGEQNLYDVTLSFVSDDGKISDTKIFKTGIREMSYSEEGGDLRIWVNGKRFIGKGGNWGFSESNLRYRGREYDIAVRYHKEQNFTMIRNWVGQTGDDEFYEACDRYGIMIDQDFWLANPVDGPNPTNPDLFMKNAEDFVKRIRNHPSIAFYCGRNEGNPPDVIDNALRKLLPEITPGIHYISNSAFGVVSGGGPYRTMAPQFYFQHRATKKLHTELGAPTMVSYESLNSMMPDSLLWPINRVWGVHDFNLESAQRAQSFVDIVKENFGEVKDVKRWLTLAQWVNYQSYRAMFEAQSKYRMGMLLWMSHSAWPSMVWQTYDYYFEPTAAYFGCQKANEPLHIQWNAFTDTIEAVNYSMPNGAGLTATMQVINMDGTVKAEKKFSLDCPIDKVVNCFPVEYPQGLSDVYFLKLKLERGNKIVSENFYWRSLKNDDYPPLKNSVGEKKTPPMNYYEQKNKNDDLTALNSLPKVKLAVKTKVVKEGNTWKLTAALNNNSKTPALMVKVKVIGEKNRKRILPVIFSDNYVSLMPGEKRVIKMELQNSDTQGEKPIVVIEGFNAE